MKEKRRRGGEHAKKSGYGGYFITAAVLAVLAAFFVFAMSGYRFLGLCFFAAACLALAFAGIKALGKRREKAALILKKIFVYAIVLGCLAGAVTESVIVTEVIGAGGSGAYAVVLGAGVNGTVPSRALWARLNAALDFAREEPEAMLVLSGGQGSGEDISETQCMYNWLTERGVDPSRLILEDRSTSTEENLTFSAEKLRELGVEPENVTIITAGYHICRAKLMAEDLGYTHVSARAAYTGYPVLELNYYLREIPAIWVYILAKKG